MVWCAVKMTSAVRAAQLLAVVRGAGLNHDRAALRRSRDIERPAYTEKLPLVIEDMEFVRIKKASGCLVANECIVLPGVPKSANDVGEFFRSSVAVAQPHMRVTAKILGLERLHGGNEIPSGPATADHVESRKPARDVIRLVVGRSRRADQPDMGGHRREYREQRDGLEAGDERGHAKIFRVVLTRADDVG